MMELTIPYDDTTRALGEPTPTDRYGGTRADVSATRIIVTGLPEGYGARLDFDVIVPLEGRKKKCRPYLDLDITGTEGSCVVPNVILRAAKDLRLPVQLVLKSETETYASRNVVQLAVMPAIDAESSVHDAFGPDIGQAIYKVSEEGGVITFTRLDGEIYTIRVDDDFVAWDDVNLAWPAAPDTESVPSTKAVDDTFLKQVLSGTDRLLKTNANGRVSADGPRVVTVWSAEPSNDAVPTEKLVADTIDEKGEGYVKKSDVVARWSSSPSDSRIPSEKLVKSELDTIRDTYIPESDLVTEWSSAPSDEHVPSEALVKRDLDDIREDYYPRAEIATEWSAEPSDLLLPSERLVKTELDLKADDSEVVHNNVGTPTWDAGETYVQGATVVHKLNLYISQNGSNVGHLPDEEGTEWWSLVKGGGGGGGGDDPGIYKAFVIGDGSTTSFTLNHGFNSYYVDYVLYDNYDESRANALTSFRRYGKDHVTVTFASPPDVDEYTVLVYRPGVGPEVVVTSVNGQVGDVVIDPVELGCVVTYPQELTEEQQIQARANLGLGELVIYTAQEKAKLESIEEGAEVNVQADWAQEDPAEDSYILNRPELGTVAALDHGVDPGQVPVLDTTGKLPSSTIPAIALTEYKGTVQTVADLVTLTDAQVGDWAVVTADPDATLCGSYILTRTATTLADWVQIVGPGKVVSVNGYGGVVVLGAADVGAVPIERSINGHALDADVTLVPEDLGAVPTDRAVNGYDLTEDVWLTADDVGAVQAVEGIVEGTYPKVTIDTQGLVVHGDVLSADDIPGLDASKIETGTLDIARIPTGNAPGTVPLVPDTGAGGQALRLNDAGTGYEWYTPPSSVLAMYTGHIEGDGATTTFTLNHGLSSQPASTLMDADGRVVTTTMIVTDTSIVVTFRTPPGAGETYTVKAVA